MACLRQADDEMARDTSSPVHQRRFSIRGLESAILTRMQGLMRIIGREKRRWDSGACAYHG